MLKRLFDFTAALLGNLLLLPVLAAIAVALRLDSPGPILYRATRVGRGGRPFAMFKFRTMTDGPAGDDGPRVTAQDDPRITALGAFLRRTKLNELPQLFNVLIGDMSLVGPRPEDPEFVAHYTAEEREVLSVRPGITSPAAVLYANEEALLRYANVTESYLADIMPSKLRLDLLYVRHRSFLLDLDVLLRTAIALLPGLGRAAPEAAGMFAGPVQQFVRRRVPWFALDWFTALAAVGAAGLIWRATGPLDFGWPRALAAASAMALTFTLANRLFGVQRTAWQYASAQEALDIAASAGLSTVVILGVDRLLHVRPPHLPLGMMVLAGSFALAGFVATRYRYRLLTGLADRVRPSLSLARERVLVVGGGEAGQLMVWMLQNGAGRDLFQVVGIVDDDLWKRGERIHRVRVLGDRHSIAKLVEQHDVGLIVYAIHHIASGEREAILDLCRATPARVVVVPDIVGLLTQLVRPARGQATARQGAPVPVADPEPRFPPVGARPPVGETVACAPRAPHEAKPAGGGHLAPEPEFPRDGGKVACAPRAKPAGGGHPRGGDGDGSPSDGNGSESPAPYATPACADSQPQFPRDGGTVGGPPSLFAPPIQLANAPGLAVDAAAVARWLDDLERLVAAGRTADLQSRLAEIRASLGVADGSSET